MEDVETLRSRPPADIDVVTFAHLGGPADQAALLNRCPELFDPHETKARFSVDAFYKNLDDRMDDESVRFVAYWYSMWAHRRGDRMWKGFVEVPLSTADDAEADRALASLARHIPDPAPSEAET